jgi:transcriptional regulator with XRE-family HTH domain
MPGRRAADEIGWEEWMRGMGRYTRRLRELAGLSQEELARRARVSQGAVSRLESGRAVQTPLIVVMKINTAMRQALAALPRETWTEETVNIMNDVAARRIPMRGTAFDEVPVTPDPLLTRMVKTFWSVPARHRAQLIAVLESMCVMLRDAGPES